MKSPRNTRCSSPADRSGGVFAKNCNATEAQQAQNPGFCEIYLGGASVAKKINLPHGSLRQYAKTLPASRVISTTKREAADNYVRRRAIELRAAVRPAATARAPSPRHG
jgi:hypothetical protein